MRDTLVHLYSAEWTWYQRWQGTSPSSMMDPVDYPDPDTLARSWHTHEQHMRAYLTSLGDAGIQQEYDFRAFNGQPHRSVFFEMLQHVVNHGTYHRGQVATMLRQLGAKPAKSVDLITFYRERAARSKV